MRLAFTYAGERLESTVKKLSEVAEGSICLPCDVTKKEEIEDTFAAIGEEFGGLDSLVHAIAYAKSVRSSRATSSTRRRRATCSSRDLRVLAHR